MAILQYYCPVHHTTKRLSRFDKFVDWKDWDGISRKAIFKIIDPICQVCRKNMIMLNGKMPKKKMK